jgi:hypothetical protein
LYPKLRKLGYKILFNKKKKKKKKEEGGDMEQCPRKGIW